MAKILIIIGSEIFRHKVQVAGYTFLNQTSPIEFEPLSGEILLTQLLGTANRILYRSQQLWCALTAAHTKVTHSTPYRRNAELTCRAPHVTFLLPRHIGSVRWFSRTGNVFEMGMLELFSAAAFPDDRHIVISL